MPEKGVAAGAFQLPQIAHEDRRNVGGLVLLEVATALEVGWSRSRVSPAPSTDAAPQSVDPLQNDVGENGRAMDARCKCCARGSANRRGQEDDCEDLADFRFGLALIEIVQQCVRR